MSFLIRHPHHPLEPEAAPLKKTPLNATHRALKAKMVDFGGWDMPVEYPGPAAASWPSTRGAQRRRPL